MLERQTPQQREPAGEQQQVQTATVDREAQQRALAEEREKKRREEIVRLEHSLILCITLVTLDHMSRYSDFIWDFRKLPFLSHLGKYFIKIGKISAKIREIGKIMAIFGL